MENTDQFSVFVFQWSVVGEHLLKGGALFKGIRKIIIIVKKYSNKTLLKYSEDLVIIGRLVF